MHDTNDENVLLQASKKLLFHLQRARRTGSTKIGIDVADLEVLGQLCDLYSKATSGEDPTLTSIQEELTALEYFQANFAMIQFYGDYANVTIGDKKIKARTLYKAYQYFTGTK
jgi:hypothetical protein